MHSIGKAMPQIWDDCAAWEIGGSGLQVEGRLTPPTTTCRVLCSIAAPTFSCSPAHLLFSSDHHYQSFPAFLSLSFSSILTILRGWVAESLFLRGANYTTATLVRCFCRRSFKKKLLNSRVGFLFASLQTRVAY